MPKGRVYKMILVYTPLSFRAGSRAEFVAVAGPSCSAAAGVAARSVAAGAAAV